MDLRQYSRDLVRYYNFCMKDKCSEPLCRLKPIFYATAVIKIKIWLFQSPTIPSLDGHGWTVEDRKLKMQWICYANQSQTSL